MSLKNNYDKSVQKVSNGQMDFERLVEQKMSDIQKISLTFDSKMEEMNKIILNASVIDEIINKVSKVENLTFAMEDMLKESKTLKNQLVLEHNK